VLDVDLQILGLSFKLSIDLEHVNFVELGSAQFDVLVV